MIFPAKDWPFKNKPVTNSYITISLNIVAMIVWMLLLIVWPAPTFGATMVFCLCKCVGAIYRSIRAEWK